MLATKQSLSNEQDQLEELKGAYSLDYNAILKSQQQIEAYQAGIDGLAALGETLFPTQS